MSIYAEASDIQELYGEVLFLPPTFFFWLNFFGVFESERSHDRESRRQK
jgi:hypothetical protein